MSDGSCWLTTERLALRRLTRKGERAFPHPDYASEGPMAWFELDATDWQVERGSARR
jgi:hypothetical protein